MMILEWFDEDDEAKRSFASLSPRKCLFVMLLHGFVQAATTFGLLLAGALVVVLAGFILAGASWLLRGFDSSFGPGLGLSLFHVVCVVLGIVYLAFFGIPFGAFWGWMVAEVLFLPAAVLLPGFKRFAVVRWLVRLYVVAASAAVVCIQGRGWIDGTWTSLLWEMFARFCAGNDGDFLWNESWVLVLIVAATAGLAQMSACLVASAKVFWHEL